MRSSAPEAEVHWIALRPASAFRAELGTIMPAGPEAAASAKARILREANHPKRKPMPGAPAPTRLPPSLWARGPSQEWTCHPWARYRYFSNPPFFHPRVTIVTAVAPRRAKLPQQSAHASHGPWASCRSFIIRTCRLRRDAAQLRHLPRAGGRE